MLCLKLERMMGDSRSAVQLSHTRKIVPSACHQCPHCTVSALSHIFFQKLPLGEILGNLRLLCPALWGLSKKFCTDSKSADSENSPERKVWKYINGSLSAWMLGFPSLPSSPRPPHTSYTASLVLRGLLSGEKPSSVA